MSDPNVGDRIAAVAAELGRLGRRLDELGAELSSLHSGAALDGGPAPAGPQPAPYPAQPWGQRPPYPDQPPPATSGAGGGRRRRSALSGARVLAWTGAGVTLLGVVLLLALAASRGWFGPGARVLGGAVLGVGLVGIAWWLHRRETSRTGATALAGTGIATLYLVVAAATALYEFLPDSAGLLLALLVAGGGLGVADRWRSPLLASGTVAGAALLAPVVTDGMVPILVVLVLVLELAATAVALRHRWPWPAVLAGFWPVLYGSLTAASGTVADRPFTAAAVLALLVVRIATALPASTRLPRPSSAGLLVTAPLPALVLAATLDGRVGAGLAAGAAALLAVPAIVPRLDRAGRIAAGTAATIALFESTVILLDGASRTAALLGQAIVLVVVAAVLRSRVLLVIGGVYGSVGVLMAMAVHLPPRTLVEFPSRPLASPTTPDIGALTAAAGVSALVLAFAVAVLVAAARAGVLGGTGLGTVQLWVPAGLVALYGAAGLVVTLALLVSPDRTGFVVGHAVVSVSWTVTALILLARGISRPALRLAGLVLVPVAVAKLILFDLVALDGIARVAAFLGAGLVLLAAGSRYARLVAEAEAAAKADTEAEPPQQDGAPGTTG
ncbi:DUF2339 domain-containing protein [Pseudonocardia asaccharolytica]|nr:DUF2339 domain-containing protein [Pseudonocardia asaccharolytica]